MPEPVYLEKVTAFITRRAAGGDEILLFEHPHAGVQFPAGTVEPGEAPEAAALRETAEETGLTGLERIACIGKRIELPPEADRVILHATSVYARPDPASFDWARLPRGCAVRLLRTADGFAQISYTEGDRWPDPLYTTYQISGWVPENALAAANRRYFYHLRCLAATPPRWEIFSDHHRFQPFWCALAELPAIVPPQRAWYDFVTRELGYVFSKEA